MVAAHPLGSIWSVLGIEDGLVVVLAGPFAASRGAPEYLVAPLYSGSEPGFVWTSEDVRLDAEETGLPYLTYAAIWNARPVLESDLLFKLGQLADDTTVVVRDAYWASLNEHELGKSPKLGRPIRNASDPAAKFQARELQRWQQVSGKALATSSGLSASSKFGMHELWCLTLNDLASLEDSIQTSEAFVGSVPLVSVGSTRVSFMTTVLFQQFDLPNVQEPSLFVVPPAPGVIHLWHGKFASVRLNLGEKSADDLTAVATNTDLAAAA